MDTRMFNFWVACCKEQCRMSYSETIFVSDCNVHVRPDNAGVDNDQWKLSRLFVVCVDLWSEFF